MKHINSYNPQRDRRRCRNFNLIVVVRSAFITHFVLFCMICLVKLGLVKADMQAMIYLSEYGYFNPQVRNPQSGHPMSEEIMSKAIMEFQAFANLNLTGYLNEETKHTMSLPRCGVRDNVGVSTHSRLRRYALQGSRWKVKDLNYRISKYPRGLSRLETDAEVARAFHVWSEVTPLTFSKSSGQVHIDIRFEVGEHGDGDPFDGPGGTLAHAFFPIYGGDAHFDDSEKWTIRSTKGTNLFQVAAHEFGHSLGLSHSDVRSALMAPFYRGYNAFSKLHPDDIEAIQALYGPRNSFGGFDPRPADGDDEDEDDNARAGSRNPTSTLLLSNTTLHPFQREDNSKLCPEGSFDAIFNSAEGYIFVFKGAYYWNLTRENIEPGYPKLISHTWLGLPNNIDAAFTYENGKTYFFKGSEYWKYDGTKMDGDYPKLIKEDFIGIPDNIQAVMVCSDNGKIYFFKGSKFWKFDPEIKSSIRSTYPKPICKDWIGIPDNIDDVLQYPNGYASFFKEKLYWKFNDKTLEVESAEPPFPRSTGYWWFGCRASRSKDNLITDENKLKKSANDKQSGQAADIVTGSGNDAHHMSAR